MALTPEQVPAVEWLTARESAPEAFLEQEIEEFIFDGDTMTSFPIPTTRKCSLS